MTDTPKKEDDFSFDDIIKQNEENKKKLAEERDAANRKLKRNLRLDR